MFLRQQKNILSASRLRPKLLSAQKLQISGKYKTPPIKILGGVLSIESKKDNRNQLNLHAKQFT